LTKNRKKFGCVISRQNFLDILSSGSISHSWNIVKMTLDPHVVPACDPSW